MTVKYTVVARGKPGDPTAPKKYYPVVKSTGRVKPRDLARQAAAMSTLSSADLAAALEIFLTIIPQELADGNIVDLGDFGSFSLRVRGEGADSEGGGGQVQTTDQRCGQYGGYLVAVDLGKPY